MRAYERVNIPVLGRKVKIFDLGVKQKDWLECGLLYLHWGKSLRSAICGGGVICSLQLDSLQRDRVCDKEDFLINFSLKN
jgi:hypothetical protein